MAEYNELGVGRYNRLLQRLLQIKADPPTRVLGTELVPTLTLESDAPEWHFLKGARLMNALFDRAGAAGVNTIARLRNPAGSNVIARVSSITVSTDLATTLAFRIGTATTDFNPGTEVAMDTRLANASALNESDDTNQAPAGSQFHAVRVLGASPYTLTEPIILNPGSHIDISTGNLIALSGAFFWLERGREESEA